MTEGVVLFSMMDENGNSGKGIISSTVSASSSSSDSNNGPEMISVKGWS